jgi:hypothetical protein
MSDVRELARECHKAMVLHHRLGADEAEVLGHLTYWLSPIYKILWTCGYGDPSHLAADGALVGPLRAWVEKECERRGWAWELTCASSHYQFSTCAWGEPYELIASANSALECALLALKYLLENPVES